MSNGSKKIRVGLIGRQFIGVAHSNAFRNAAIWYDLPCKVVMKAVCVKDAEARLPAFAEKFGWELRASDWRKLAMVPQQGSCRRPQGHQPGTRPVAIAGRIFSKGRACSRQLTFVIILASMALVIGVGVFAGQKKSATAHGYFLGGNKMPWWLIGTAFVATGISSEQMIGTVGAAYQHGMGIANWEWFGLACPTVLSALQDKPPGAVQPNDFPRRNAACKCSTPRKTTERLVAKRNKNAAKQ